MNLRKAIATIELVGILGFGGCNPIDESEQILPNHKVVKGIVYQSKAYPNHQNLKSLMGGLVEKSRITGKVIFLEKFNNQDTFIEMVPDKRSYCKYKIKITEERSNVPISYLKIKKGDRISIPTLRKYDAPDKVYKILNNADTWRADEVIIVDNSTAESAISRSK